MSKINSEEIDGQRPQVLRIARAAGHPEPEEVVQQVALIYLSAQSSSCEIRDPAAWISRVARRTAFASVVKGRSYPPTLSEDLECHAPPEHRAIAEERKSLLWQVVASLPPRQQEVLKAISIDGQTFSQVATRIGCSTNTCKTWFYRAKQALKDHPRLRSLNEI